MFTPTVEDSVGLKVLSLSEGDFLEEGDSVDFVIQTEDPNAEPVLLEIALIDRSGQSVWNTDISSPLTDEELELILPDLETDQYTIRFTVHGEEGVVEEQRVGFFYVAGLYDIQGITSYPPTTMAGHETIIEADLLYPEEANPYVRWSQGESILAAGRVSEGLRSITWLAPEEEGVYSIQVELFPVPPPVGTDFSFLSAVALTAQLYVSSASSLSEDELVPEDSYYSLFHLNGSLQNSGFLGVETTQEEAQVIGDAKLSSEKGLMGYKTGAGAGLYYPLNILPILDGKLSPCTITFKLQPSVQNEDRNLMVITDRSEGFRFRVFFDSEGQLAATLGIRDTVLYLPSNIPVLKPEQHRRIDLSLVPIEEELQALWFLDGRQTAVVSDGPLPAELFPEGQTVIAGENGFEGIITELGVYYKDPFDRPSVDPAIYRQAMQHEHGRFLVLAEGFEGLYLPDPDSWRLKSSKQPYLDGGRLILPASSSLTLPYFELGEEETTFLVEFFGDISPGSTIALQWEGTEDPFLTIDPMGKIFSGSESPETEEFSPTGSSVRLSLSRRSLTLDSAEAPVRFSFETPADPNTWMSVTLRSPEQEGDVEIDTILIVQEPSS
jgi:hypothetical protein